MFCNTVEDNTSVLELAHMPKMQPHTKHININCHHFWEYVLQGEIKIYAISTEDQLAAMLTKQLPHSSLVYANKFLKKKEMLVIHSFALHKRECEIV